jgi:site-specific DNA-methyltransferase (adenine-specific)
MEENGMTLAYSEIGNGWWIEGDCFEAMAEIADHSIDMILCDLPYGTTACKWDAVLPFDQVWAAYRRICKPNGAIVLTASQPFTSALIASNFKDFRYCWVWEKQQGTNPMLAKKQCMKVHEDICVFSTKPHLYNPQMRKGKAYSGFSSEIKTTGEIMGKSRSVHRDNPEGMLYPRSVLKYNTDRGKGFHPTQKPIALFEYLIRTYTDEGMTALDNTAGSGTTAIAAEKSGRKWVCIERDPEYSAKAQERIRSHVNASA